YASDLFDHVTVERFAEYFQTMLAAMLSEPARPLATLPLIGQAERDRLLVAFNATAADYPSEMLLHQLFEEQAARQPDATAIVFEDQHLSYSELNRRANRLAHRLIAQGVVPDARVAICVERSLDMIVGLLAILKAGGAYVPLDPAYPRDRLDYMLRDCAPSILLTHRAFAQFMPMEAPMPVVLFDAAQMGDDIHGELNLSVAALCPRHLAYVIYTSGSTGMPKGVMIEHANACNLIVWAMRHFSPEQSASTLFATSINFDLAVYEMFLPLSSGSTVTLVKDILAPGVSLASITHINTVPSAAASLLATGRILPSVSGINLAGEPLKAQLVEQLFAGTATRYIANLYGPTETTTYSTWTRFSREGGFRPGIGRPIANTQIYILDPHGQPVPSGVTGEIHIGGAGVARGYLNRPELTAERFVADPFSTTPGARMYKTGDLARWLADGNIEYLG
ncbi:non-ribosomal peptide synthetase, partial [Massilia aurea]|uniref:non-ribosomal peptide synthetase n=2 Tax=Massilia aurea TaxID=373040 RepID=UPI0031D99EE2